jgi:hypothetical protein
MTTVYALPDVSSLSKLGDYPVPVLYKFIILIAIKNIRTNLKEKKKAP